MLPLLHPLNNLEIVVMGKTRLICIGQKMVNFFHFWERDLLFKVLHLPKAKKRQK